jgi:hypothetical protein
MAPGTYQQLLITIACTTVLWVATAYLGPQTAEGALINFYHKVRPPGPGWQHVRVLAGVSDSEAKADAAAMNLPISLLGWSTGCIMVWSALFSVGNFLYGRWNYFAVLLAIFVVSGIVMIRVVNRLWK